MKGKVSAVLPEENAAGCGTAALFSLSSLMLMDETVAEVFSVMLGLEVAATGAHASQPKEQPSQADFTALIGFAGIVTGICEISLGREASLAVTQAMLNGAGFAEDTESISDAVGELCNMLAGGWKNRLPELAADCSLSVPVVIAGSAYELHRPADLMANRRAYRFGKDHLLRLALFYEPD